MAGWNLKAGAITEYVVSEDKIWSLFNFVFSDACKKRNTYKFGLIKSLLDSAFSGEMTEQGVRYSYEELFGRFAYNYWNLVVKYDLRQMRKDGKSELSKIELIFKFPGRLSRHSGQGRRRESSFRHLPHTDM